MDDWIKTTQDQVRSAAAQGLRLRVTGHDSLRHWIPPDPQAHVLSTQPYAGIVNYEPSELVVTVRAGTLLQDLQHTLTQHHQCLPFDPPVCAKRTVGAMVASGFAGSTRVSAGSVRDYVLGAHVINGRGEWLQLGGQVMKNVAGYDLGRLYAASWGTLGIMTQVSLKVMPIPPADITLAVRCRAEEAMTLLRRARPQSWPLVASLWVGSGDQAGLLTLRWRGAQASVSLAHQSWCEQLHRDGFEIHTLDAEKALQHWGEWRDMKTPFFDSAAHQSQDLWRSVVPWETPLSRSSGEYALDWHGGLRWQWVPREQRTAESNKALVQRWRHFRVPTQTEGVDTHPLSCRGLSLSEQQLQRRVQLSVDPHGVFLPAALRGEAC